MQGLTPDINASNAKLDHMEASMSAKLGAMKASIDAQEQHLQHLYGRVNGLEQAQQGTLNDAVQQAVSVAMDQKMNFSYQSSLVVERKRRRASRRGSSIWGSLLIGAVEVEAVLIRQGQGCRKEPAD